MIRRLSILLLLLLPLGCADQGVEPQPAPPSLPLPHSSSSRLVPGVVVIVFNEGTATEEAEKLINRLDLSFLYGPSGSPPNGVVSVPINSEDQWVKMLRDNPMVKQAERLVVFSTG